MKKIGIFAGTFDPVHKGHISFAREAAKACALDKVFFVAERNPRNKASVTDLAHRVKMLELATTSYDDLEVLELPDAQFTVFQTLPKLQEKFAGAEMIFLLGSDVAKNLARWKNIEQLLSNVKFAIAVRSKDKGINIPNSSILITTPHTHISASQIRSGQAKESIDPAVQKYISRHGIYNRISMVL